MPRKPLATHIRRLQWSLTVPPIPRSWIAFLYRHPKLTFLLMGVFFLLFGFTSVNLFVVLKANIDLFIEYGAMVIEDGALRQLVEIIGNSYLSIVFYVCFKVCERVLIERLAGKPLRAVTGTQAAQARLPAPQGKDDV
ncbi:MAG: hypothetical protein ABI607_02805 [Betaproteobacteria bacterium]